MNIRTVFNRCLVFAALVGLWMLATFYFGFYWASSPRAVLERIVEWAVSGSLWYHTSMTLMAVVIGFTFGAVPGTILPFLLRRHPVVTAILDPYMVGGYAIPKLAIMPLMIVWLGVGIWPKVALVATLCFFISFFTTQAGIRGVSPQLVRMAEIVGASDGRVGRSIVLPASLSYVFAGVRVAIPFAVGGTVVAEMFSANRGLGYLIQSSAMSFDSTGSFAAIVVLTIIVAAINVLFGHLETMMFGWRPKAGSRQGSNEMKDTAS
jgi:NitT/TauT family transport system permease protein